MVVDGGDTALRPRPGDRGRPHSPIVFRARYRLARAESVRVVGRDSPRCACESAAAAAADRGESRSVCSVTVPPGTVLREMPPRFGRRPRTLQIEQSRRSRPLCGHQQQHQRRSAIKTRQLFAPLSSAVPAPRSGGADVNERGRVRARACVRERRRNRKINANCEDKRYQYFRSPAVPVWPTKAWAATAGQPLVVSTVPQTV